MDKAKKNVAVLCGIVGYGVMNLLMTATLLAIMAFQHPFSDAAIFITMVVSSFSSGALFTYQGRQTMNMYAVPFLILAVAGIFWLALRRRQQGAAA